MPSHRPAQMWNETISEKNTKYKCSVCHTILPNSHNKKYNKCPVCFSEDSLILLSGRKPPVKKQITEEEREDRRFQVHLMIQEGVPIEEMSSTLEVTIETIKNDIEWVRTHPDKIQEYWDNL